MSDDCIGDIDIGKPLSTPNGLCNLGGVESGDDFDCKANGGAIGGIMVFFAACFIDIDSTSLSESPAE